MKELSFCTPIDSTIEAVLSRPYQPGELTESIERASVGYSSAHGLEADLLNVYYRLFSASHSIDHPFWGAVCELRALADAARDNRVYLILGRAERKNSLLSDTLLNELLPNPLETQEAVLVTY